MSNLPNGIHTIEFPNEQKEIHTKVLKVCTNIKNTHIKVASYSMYRDRGPSIMSA